MAGHSDPRARFAGAAELSTHGSVERLIGSAWGDEGTLFTALRSQPFSVVLFDEVEKAHPRVFDALLQFLGEGRLSDANGRVADGRNCVVVMTSNLGVREAASQTGFARVGVSEARQHYLSAAQAFFRPELFNRIDRVVAFRSLDTGALRVVVEHALAQLLGRRGLQQRNVLVDVEPELLDLLVEQAFDPRYGARPLKRALERYLALPLAHHLVKRDADTLALVELLRAGDEAQLSVKLLQPAASVPVPPVQRWTMESAQVATQALAEEVDCLLRSDAGRADPHGVVVEGLRQVRDQLTRLLDGPLEPVKYEELVEAAPKQLTRARGRQPKMGNRQAPQLRSVHYTVNEASVIDAIAPELALAHREVAIGRARLAVSVEGQLPRTVLVRCLHVVGEGPLVERLRRWEAEAAEARERRRQGGPELVDPWPRLVIDGDRFVSTGLPSANPQAQLEATLT